MITFINNNNFGVNCCHHILYLNEEKIVKNAENKVIHITGVKLFWLPFGTFFVHWYSVL